MIQQGIQYAMVADGICTKVMKFVHLPRRGFIRELDGQEGISLTCAVQKGPADTKLADKRHRFLTMSSLPVYRHDPTDTSLQPIYSHFYVRKGAF